MTKNYQRSPKMTKNVILCANDWPCDIILSHKNINLSDYLLHEGNAMKHEQITKAIVRGSKDLTYYVTTREGSTKFATKRLAPNSLIQRL